MERGVGAHPLSNPFVELRDMTVDVHFPGVGSPSTNIFDGGVRKSHEFEGQGVGPD